MLKNTGKTLSGVGMRKAFFYVVEIAVGGDEWTNDWALVDISSVRRSARGSLIPGLEGSDGRGWFTW